MLQAFTCFVKMLPADWPDAHYFTAFVWGARSEYHVTVSLIFLCFCCKFIFNLQCTIKKFLNVTNWVIFTVQSPKHPTWSKRKNKTHSFFPASDFPSSFSFSWSAPFDTFWNRQIKRMKSQSRLGGSIKQKACSLDAELEFPSTDLQIF